MRDRFITRFAIAMAMSCMGYSNAHCFYVDSFVGMGKLSLDEDLIVTDGGNLYSSRVDIVSSISILNRGVINSDFYIGDATRVYVKNSGDINGAFYVLPNSRLFQVIQSADDVTYINADTNFSILVYDAENIVFTDIVGISSSADKIILNNSSLMLNTNTRLLMPPLEIVGDVVLKVSAVDYASPVLQNVSGDGRIRVDVSDLSPLYNVSANITDGNLYINLVRETDYARIFQNDVGKFLGDLRNALPNDKLLRAMDNAPDIDALNSVMSDSLRLHPGKLMLPVRRMHMMDAMGGWRYGNASVVHSTADVIFSDTATMRRANIATMVPVVQNLYAAIGGYIAMFDVSDNINDFSGRVFGTNLNLHFDDGVFIGNLSGGVAGTEFDVGPVFDGNKSVNNPSGISGFMSMDVGANVLDKSDLTIAPFVGVVTNYASVVDTGRMDTNANIGIDVNWSVNEFDILYDYGGRINVLTDGTIYTGAFIKFSAPDDGVGGEIGVSLIRDEYDTGYKVSVSAHMLF